VVGAQDNRLTVRFYSLVPDASDRVLGIHCVLGVELA
jgi:hypothetical protein